MLAFGREGKCMILAGLGILLLLTRSAHSASASLESVNSHRTTQPIPQKFSPQLLVQIKLHALLLWASIGFLMPVGILIIRMSNRVDCGRKLKVLFYSHVSLQVIATLLATIGAVLSIKNFANSFNNTHQRIGLALYFLIWVQPLIGFCRPHRGLKARSLWYFVHWLLGTGISILGIINIYVGLHAYREKTSTSVKLWSILFTVEVAIIGFLSLFQDRWDYMQKQGVTMGEEQIRPTDHLTSPKSQRVLR